MGVSKHFTGKRFFQEIPSQVWVAGRWVFILLFLMMGLYYVGMVEAVARGLRSLDDMSSFLVIAAVPSIIAFLGFALKGRNRRLGFTLGWVALFLALWRFPMLTGLWGLPMWIGAWTLPMLGWSLVLLTLSIATLVALMIAVGKDPDYTSLWGTLGLLFVLGIALIIRGSSASLASSLFILSGVLMSLALPLHLLRKVRTWSLLLAVSGMLFFAAMLFLNLHSWEGGLYLEYLTISLSRLATIGLGILVSGRLLFQLLRQPSTRDSKLSNGTPVQFSWNIPEEM